MISTAVKAGAGAAFAESCSCSSSFLKDRRIAPENKLAPYTHEGVPRQLLVWLNPGLFPLRSTSAPICSARSPSKMVSPHAKVKNLILSGARLIDSSCKCVGYREGRRLSLPHCLFAILRSTLEGGRIAETVDADFKLKGPKVAKAKISAK